MAVCGVGQEVKELSRRLPKGEANRPETLKGRAGRVSILLEMQRQIPKEKPKRLETAASEQQGRSIRSLLSLSFVDSLTF